MNSFKTQEKIEKKIEANLYKKLLKEYHKTAVQTAHLFARTFKDNVVTAIIAALSFLVALVWRDFITKLIKETLSTQSSQHPYLAELYSAIIVSLIAIIGILFLSKWSNKK